MNGVGVILVKLTKCFSSGVVNLDMDKFLVRVGAETATSLLKAKMDRSVIDRAIRGPSAK